VVAILAILLSLGGLVYGNFVRQDQLNTEVLKIKNLFAEAQVKTLAGYTGGETDPQNFGLYFEEDSFFLFLGSVYNPSENRNQAFLLPESLTFSEINLPSDSVVFERVSGQVVDFDTDQNYLILTDSLTGQAKRLTINQLGVVVVENEV